MASRDTPKDFPTPSELEVLRAMGANGLYGLEIARLADVAQTGIYILLQRLVRKGYVHVERRTYDHPGMPRRIYKRTTNGNAIVRLADSLKVAT